MTDNPSPVSVRRDDEVAVILSNNPPINALGHAVRSGIASALEELVADDRVKAIILACEGRTFFAGADMKEFGRPRESPTLQEVIAKLEQSAKPTVAAIHGTALGGGFELAMGCTYRVMRRDAVVGLPEITLGLFAGGGGTKRLPRLIGPMEALKLCLSGERVSAERALSLGAVDAVDNDNVIAMALSFARSIIDKPFIPVRDRVEKLAGARADPADYEVLANRLTARSKGQIAPGLIVKSVRDAFSRDDLDEALAEDAAINLELMKGSQSRALRHLFFAERQAAQIPGIPASEPPRKIGRVAIIGAGTMGSGIAMCFANAHIPVVLIDASSEALDRGTAQIRANYANSVKRGSIAADAAETRMAVISSDTNTAAAAEADLVIEAVFEDLELKKSILADVERRVQAGTLLATNTSALGIDHIAEALERPGDFIGMHFFAPANVMKLVEVIQGGGSSSSAVAAAMAVSRKVGKVPVWSGNCDGFIGNRMLARRAAEAERLLQRGAFPHEVDGALTDLGFPMGPLATNDMSGLDVGYSIRRRRGTPFPIADAIVEKGWLGQKTGTGYYRYEPGDRTPLRNPDAEALILEVARNLGVERRDISAKEMSERMLFPLINEGARILEEGIALRSSDIDLVWTNGYGWPRYLGGPMFHADEVGLRYVLDRLEAFAADSDEMSLAPASLLRELATHGESFAQWRRAPT